jgi:hypothetical protein
MASPLLSKARAFLFLWPKLMLRNPKVNLALALAIIIIGVLIVRASGPPV